MILIKSIHLYLLLLYNYLVLQKYIHYDIKKIKRVPLNIQNLLISLALAHCIMGDGFRQNKGIHLSVYAFTPEEVELLISVL
jgi:LAGLIDADG DNA endonuclease family